MEKPISKCSCACGFMTGEKYLYNICPQCNTQVIREYMKYYRPNNTKNK